MSALADRRQAMNMALRGDFSFFVECVFGELNPGVQLKRGWHIAAMCHGLDRVRRGADQRLLITVPPRHLKSITVSVAFVAWSMGHDPSLKFLVASYGGDLSTDLSRQFRRVVTTTWFKSAFPEFRISRNAEGDLATTKAGYRKAVSVGGASTGFGADYIIVDDILKAADASSPAARAAATDFYRGSLISRFNDQERGRVIVIAQRLHEDDLPGHCLESGLFAHVNLPAIAQMDEMIPLGGGRTRSRRAGDLLCPELQSRPTLDRILLEQGPAAFAAQYLQDPTPAESHLIRWHDIKRYQEAPPRAKLTKVVQSWDTADTVSPHSDYSVCTTWGFHEGSWLLLDVDRFQAAFRDLVDRVRARRSQWMPDLLLIEDANGGRSLIEELKHEASIRRRSDSTIARVHACKPRVSKVERWAAQARKLETGAAIIPFEAPWLDGLRREVVGFPNAKYDDQVDSISQFLEWTSWGRTARTLEREHLNGPDDRQPRPRRP